MKKTGLLLLVFLACTNTIWAQTKPTKLKPANQKQVFQKPVPKESNPNDYYRPEITDEYTEVKDAQPRMDVNNVRIGAYLSPNISWMHPTSSKSSDGDFLVNSNQSIVGFSWGLMADYFFTENYGFATGFQLNNTGGNIHVSRKTAGDTAISFVEDADITYRVQYLEIPFCLKLKSDEIANGIRIFGQLGLSAGFNIGKKATYNIKYWDADLHSMNTVSGDKEKLYGSFTVAPMNLQLNVGLGVEKKISRKMDFYFGVFFNNGFLPDATKPEELNLGFKGRFTDGNVRLNNLAFRFGLFF
jgi:hypothetical protein